MVISALIKEVQGLLADNARFEAELIVMHVTGVTRTKLITDGGRVVNDEERIRALETAKRRRKGEPLQYILGEAEFMSLSFYVREGVLIPRADTETLAECVLEEAEEDREYSLLDICTGSGCIGVSLAHYRKRLTAELLDISDIALETAGQNILRNNVQDRVSTLKLDILKEYPRKKYDIIVSNPPYIEADVIETLQTEVKDYEPRIALDGGRDGLVFYRRISEIAPLLLKSNGLLALEIGYTQAEAVTALLHSGFKDIRTVKDLAGNNRVVMGRMK